MGLRCSVSLALLLFVNWTMDAPTWPTMLKPVGNTSCSASGSMALITSSSSMSNSIQSDTRALYIHTVVPVVIV